MIYRNYFEVPGDEMCRPYFGGTGHSFRRKSEWYCTDSMRLKSALGQWETVPRKIEITEEQIGDWLNDMRLLPEMRDHLSRTFYDRFFGKGE